MMTTARATTRRAMTARTAHPASWMVYLELAKGRLTALVLLTTGVGYWLARGGPIRPVTFLCTLLGTALTAGGANALNQWIEVWRDARMERTCRRPLPTGRVNAAHAFSHAIGAIAIGSTVLAGFVNGLTAALGLAAATIYVLLYTPLKVRSSLCTLVGAVCGAVPPMMGWTAATGRLEYGAWALGAVLFAWQVPHFLSLAWLCRHDYARGGFRPLPVIDPTGRAAGQIVVLYCLAMLPLGLTVTLAGITGAVYAIGSLILGMTLVVLGAQLYRHRTDASARRLFVASIVYLPLLLGLMVADRGRITGHGSTSSERFDRHVWGHPVSARYIATDVPLAQPSFDDLDELGPEPSLQTGSPVRK